MLKNLAEKSTSTEINALIAESLGRKRRAHQLRRLHLPLLQPRAIGGGSVTSRFGCFDGFKGNEVFWLDSLGA